MILKKDLLSQRESKNSDHRIHNQLKYNYPTSRSPFSIHHNESTDSYSPQPFILTSKTKKNLTKTSFSLKKSRKVKQSKFKSSKQLQQFDQQNQKLFQFVPLRTISYQQTRDKNNQNQKLKGEIMKNQLFSRQNIQQNNKKLNLLRKQNSKQTSLTNMKESHALYKQKQKMKTVFKSAETSPAFKITSSNGSKFYRNDLGSKTSNSLQKSKDAQKNFQTILENLNKQRNSSKNQNQTRIKFKNKNQEDKNLNQNQSHLKSEVEEELLKSEQFVLSKVFMENQTFQNNWEILKPVKILVHTNHQSSKKKTRKQQKEKSAKNRKSVPLFLGLYKQEKRELTNQTQQVQQIQQNMIKSSQESKFRPKLKMKKNDDNMNVLATILRKKSNIMSKKQLIEYLHKIIS